MFLLNNYQPLRESDVLCLRKGMNLIKKIYQCRSIRIFDLSEMKPLNFILPNKQALLFSQCKG